MLVRPRSSKVRCRGLRIPCAPPLRGQTIDMSNAPFFVSAQVASEVVTWPELIRVMAEVYRMPHTPDENPGRVVARGQGTWLRTLPAILPTGTFMGAKLFGLGRRRAVSYAVVLFSQETGEIAGILDGESLTAFRTAATSAVAVDHLMSDEPVRLGVLGSGSEAHSHVRAVAAIRTISELSVFSPSADNRTEFARCFSEELGTECRPVETAREAVTGQSLVIAAARSRDETPIFESAWVSDGTLVVSIGSTLPDQREVDTALIARSDFIVADSPEEVMEGTGDFIAAKRDNIPFHDKVVSLNGLLRGEAREMAAAARLPLFKSVGSAVQDLVVAELALRKATEMKQAVRLPEFVLKTGRRR